MWLLRPRTALCAAIFLALAACTQWRNNSGAAAEPEQATGFVHTHHEDVLDGNGNKLMLRGVGLGNWMLPEGYMWHFYGPTDRPRRIEKVFSDLIGPEKAAAFWEKYRTTYITQADIQRIAELGFNSCRPALDARMFMSEDGTDTFHPEAFAILDNLIAWASAAHIYVIIDMHAAPGGETGQNIDDSADDQPLLFMDPKYEQRLTKLWLKIADRYKNEPAVAGYDLLNEPLPERTGAAKKYKSQLEPLYKRLAAAIRTVDKKHMLTVEGANWANDWSVFTGKFDDNLVHQFHYYCWDNPTNLKSIQGYLDAQKKLGTPIWVGETGERDADIYFATTDLFESHNIGWSFWPWKKMEASNGIYSARLPDGWDAVTHYADDPDKNPKPAADDVERMLNELLNNIRLENCRFTPSTVNALFHRLPIRLEAENYGHDGLAKSYFVKDPSKKSPNYRKNEPVTILPVEAPNANGTRRRRNGGEGGQAIHLTAGEWTAYEVNNPQPKTCNLTLRVNTDQAPATVSLLINHQIIKTPLNQTGWQEIKLAPANLPAGPIEIKMGVDDGAADIDWLDIQ